MHFGLLFLASAHFGCSNDRAQMWVVWRERSLDSIPPRAIMAPVIASLSIEGMSAQVRMTFEKIILGSGEKGRTWASLFRAMVALIQSDRTTGIIIA